ncbi:MAG: hypothetical protein ACREMH_11345 [Gemmatimonadales bacterium]
MLRGAATTFVVLTLACGPRDRAVPSAADTAASGQAAPAGAAAELEAAERAVAPLRARFGSMDRVDGALVRGDVSSSFRAYYEGEQLRGLEVSVEQGDFARSEEEYFLMNGGVVHFASRGVRARTEPGAAAGTTDSLRYRVALDGAGGVVAGEKLVNGAAEPVEDYRAAIITSQARTLDETARALRRP